MEQLRLPIAAIQHLINYWRSGAIKFVSWQASQTINTSRKTSDPTSFLALNTEKESNLLTAALSLSH